MFIIEVYTVTLSYAEPLILELKIEHPQDKVMVIGDLHGDLKSLTKLMEIIKNENPKYVIFLGDIVDRGLYQLECLILILALKIKDSNKYFLFVHPVTNVPKHKKHNTT